MNITQKKLVVLLGLVFTGVYSSYYLYQAPYPDIDYNYFITVLRYITGSASYQPTRLLDLQVTRSINRSPIFFYAAAGFMKITGLSAFHTLQASGVLATAALFVVSGLPWRSTEDALRSALITIIFIRLATYANPLIGTERGYVPALFAGWLYIIQYETSPFFRRIFFAITTALYPIVSIVVLIYYTLHQKIRTILVLTAVFFIVTAPYWFGTLTNPHTYSGEWIPAIDYTEPLFRAFLLGGSIGKHPGALFITPTLFTMVVAGAIILVFAFLYTTPSKPLLRFGAASILAWGVAHVIHPTIHHPMKYTRVALPLIGLYFLIRYSVAALRYQRRQPTTSAGFVVFGASLGVAGCFVGGLLVVNSPVLYWGVALITVIAIYLGVRTRFIPTAYGVYFAALALLIAGSGFGVRPHSITKEGRGIPVHNLTFINQHLNKKARTNKTIVGPPDLAGYIQSQTSVNAYITATDYPVSFVCDRIRTFSTIYFSNNLETIYNYLVTNNIDYLLVDRNDYRIQYSKYWFNCGFGVKPDRKQGNAEYALDRNLSAYSVRSVRSNKRSIYLVTPMDIKRLLPHDKN